MVIYKERRRKKSGQECRSKKRIRRGGEIDRSMRVRERGEAYLGRRGRGDAETRFHHLVI